jgi:hypothetical protein
LGMGIVGHISDHIHTIPIFHIHAMIIIVEHFM